MIVYNITFLLEKETHEDWLEWIKSIYIPETMHTGLFRSFRILHVLGSPNEGETFCVQFEAASLKDYEEYLRIYASRIQQSLQQKFENKQVSFSSVMKIIG